MDSDDIFDAIVEVDKMDLSAVGPIMRSGEVAEAVMDAIAEDNAPKKVFILDRGDYIRIHTMNECRLKLKTLEKHLGREYDLARLELEMPSFSGRINTSTNEYHWH